MGGRERERSKKVVTESALLGDREGETPRARALREQVRAALRGSDARDLTMKWLSFRWLADGEHEKWSRASDAPTEMDARDALDLTGTTGGR